ncbi:MAG: helix-turn-helix domain-containing protein [Oscillospiraceae bacterium]|nr:helix-turn-helix domain-containing protein [Oscillospiraceae bacterium]
MTRLNENIKELRRQRQLTQKQLADMIGKSAGQIGDWENGRVDIPVSVAYNIAEKTGVDIYWLMTGQQKESRRYKTQFRVYNEADRKTIVPILVANGYDVGQHKQQRTATGKTVDYFIHITDNTENLESTR